MAITQPLVSRGPSWGCGEREELLPEWAYSRESSGLSPSTTASICLKYAFSANALLWSYFALFPIIVYHYSECDPEGGMATMNSQIVFALFFFFMAVFTVSLYLEVTILRLMLPVYLFEGVRFRLLGLEPSFRTWFCMHLLMSSASHADLATNGLFMGRLMRTGACEGNSIGPIWHRIMRESMLGRLPLIAEVTLPTFALVLWCLMLLQLFYALGTSIETKFHTIDEDTIPGQPSRRYSTLLQSWQGPHGALMSLAECGRMISVTAQTHSYNMMVVGRNNYKGLGVSKVRRLAWKFTVFFLCESAPQPHLQASTFGVLMAASGGHKDMLTLLSIMLSLGGLRGCW